jgi:hypothetical protein
MGLGGVHRQWHKMLMAAMEQLDKVSNELNPPKVMEVLEAN